MINRFLLLICLPAFSYATSFTDGSKDFDLSGGNDACWFDFNNDGWTDNSNVKICPLQEANNSTASEENNLSCFIFFKI